MFAIVGIDTVSGHVTIYEVLDLETEQVFFVKEGHWMLENLVG